MNRFFTRNYTFLFLFSLLVFSSCKKDDPNPEAIVDCETININLFSLEKDKMLGAQIDSQLFASPAEYPILDSVAYPVAYGHLKRITNNILNGGKVAHRADFVWKTRIIKDDSTLNAFCTPGGYI